MNFSSLQSSVQKFGMNQALKYLEKDPETNIPKLMNLVDKVMPEGWYGSQRKLIREQIDEKGVWYDYILKLYDLDAGVRQAVFKNFIFNASLNGSTKQEELSEKYNCNILHHLFHLLVLTYNTQDLHNQNILTIQQNQIIHSCYS